MESDKLRATILNGEFESHPIFSILNPIGSTENDSEPEYDIVDLETIQIFNRQ